MAPPAVPIVPPPTAAPVAMPAPMPIVSARVAHPEMPTTAANRPTAMLDLIIFSLRQKELKTKRITPAIRASVGDGLLRLVTTVKNQEERKGAASAPRRPRGAGG